MDALKRPTQILRFGVFEVDLSAGDLRKGGLKVKLQEQPFQVLAMLLAHPGEVATREELRSKLWPADTFVDFETGINTAIKKIRDALGDTAESPRFVETLPRRGYRFIAPVDGYVGLAGGQPGVPPLQTEVPQTKKLGLRYAAVIAAAAVIVAAVLVFVLRSPLPAPKVLRTVQITSDRRTKHNRIATDGSRIFFSEIVGGHWTPASVPMSGGETFPIPTPFRDAVILDISPSGSELLAASLDPSANEHPLWVLPTVGGVPRRLGDVLSNWEGAAWSPDGRTIVYVKDHRDLYLVKSDGTDSRKLMTPPGRPYFPRWSPDGTRISFSLDDDKSNTLWEVSADGANLHPRLPGWNFPSAACSGYWTPDGKYFLFDSYRDGPDNIWAIREKVGFFEKVTPQPMQLTTVPFDAGKPLPSKDGKRIFFLGEQPRGELVRYDAKSATFLPFLSGISAEMPDFTRDREWVTYVSLPEANLIRSKADGSELLQLTSPPLRASAPRWSPDGKKIAFVAQTPARPWKIYIISADGRNAQPVMLGEGPEFDPGWSPDGSSLVFYSESSPERVPSKPMPIHLLDLKTKRVSTLPGSENRFYPRWSPDGRYIAATADDFQKVVLYDFKTQNWVDLAVRTTKDCVYYPTWSPDGQYIYFIDWSAEANGYYRVRMRDHKVERVIDLRDVPVTVGTSGVWLGLAPDDSPLLVHEVGDVEIYALDWEAP